MGRKPNYDNYTLQRLIYDREDLTAIEKHLLCVIFWHRNHETGDCHPGIRKLSERSGLSKTTITKYTRITEQKNALAVERKPGRGGNWYYSPLDDWERAKESTNGRTPPQDFENPETQPTETREEPPMLQDLDPPVAKLLEEVQALGITETTEIREDVLICIEELQKQGYGWSQIKKKFNDAGIPRLRGGSKPWTDMDIYQMWNKANPKQEEPKEDLITDDDKPSEPLTLEDKCRVCWRYHEPTNWCDEAGMSRDKVTECPLPEDLF